MNFIRNGELFLKNLRYMSLFEFFCWLRRRFWRKIKIETREGLINITYWSLKLLMPPIPKNKKLILFGTQGTRFFEGNTKFLFEYMLERFPEFTMYWVCHSRESVKQLEEAGYPFVKAFSYKGIWNLLRAVAGVVTHDISDISFHVKGVQQNQVIINCGHGNAVKWSGKTMFRNSRLREPTYNEKVTTYQLATSDFIGACLLKRSRLKNEQIAVTGYPKNDFLIANKDKNKQNISFKVLYVPTSRYSLITGEPIQFFPFEDFDLEKLIPFLKKHNIKIFLRPHPSDVGCMELAIEASESNQNSHALAWKRIKKIIDRSEYIQFLPSREWPITYEFLPEVDLLISDYSSIFQDYLLLDRPIFFIPYDYDIFEDKYGFVYDYKEYLPGPWIKSQEQFIIEFQNILKGSDQFVEKRKILRDLIHKFQDSNSCQRVANLLIQEIRND